MAEADPGRPTWWLVTYDLNPSFFELAIEEQLRLKNGDYVYGIATAIERKWKAAYTTTDLNKGWLLFNLRSRAEAEEMVQGYVMSKYFSNLVFTPVYSATKGGLNLKLLWEGFKEFLKRHFKSRSPGLVA
jgi:hypothetical protein